MTYLLRAAGAVLLFALASCNGQNGQPVVSQAQIALAETDVATIAQAVAVDAPAIAQLSGVDPAAVTSAATEISTAAKAMSSATSSAAQQTAFKTVEANVNILIAQAAQAKEIPPQYQQDLAAVSVLLPVVEMAIDLGVSAVQSNTAATTTTTTPAAAAPADPAEVERARLRLLAVPHR